MPKKAKKKSKTAKKKNGRPTKYKPEHNEQAYKLCLLGATDEQMADFFGVSKSTINEWKLKKKGFLDSLKKGKIDADANVAKALYHRAIGYEHPDTHIALYKGKAVKTKLIKHYPPDTAAAFIWLKNRAGWKDKQEHEHNIGEQTLKTVLGIIDGSTKGTLPAGDPRDSSSTP